MKKIISILLLLAMCIGCFAGCASEPASTEDAGLKAAKDYLFAMYKDSAEKTAVDYTVVSQVVVEGTTYPITWTVDASEDVIKVVKGEDNFTTIDIVAAPAEQLNYNLTATLSNAAGQTLSVSFKHFVPKADGAAVTLADGTYVILAGNLTMSALSADKTYGYPYANEITVTDGVASGYQAADVLTIKNVDGGFTIQDAQGRYFYLKGTYNSFNVDATAPAEGHIFSILSKDGKYLIQNNLEKKTLAYSTSYSSWGCYPELTDDHTSLVDIIAVTASDATPAPDSGNNNSGNTGNNNTGSTGGDKVDTNKTSATIYFSADKLYVTGTEYIYTSSKTGKSKVELTLSDKKADAIALTIKTNSDKTISFTAEGKYLFCDGTDVKFVSSQSNNTKFVLESAGKDKYFIKCAVANYDGKAQYLEVYSGYLTCYSLYADSDTSIYTFELKDTSGAKGKITSAGSTSGGNTSGGNTSGGNTSGGNTSGGNTSGGTTTDTTKTSATIYFSTDKLYVTGTADIYTSSSGSQKEQLVLSSKKEDAIALTIKTNSDKTISFVAEGKYLYADGTHVKFVSSQSDNTKFVLESAGTNKYYIKCAVANYQGKPQYLEAYYEKLTCYGMGSDTSKFIFELKDTSGANGKITAASTSGGNTSGGNSGSTGDNTGSGTVDVDGKLAASIDLTGTTTRTSYSTSKIVHAANGITYTNEKGSSTNNFYDMTGKTYATRAYQGSTVKIEYKNMVAIVLHLDDFEQSGKTYMAGFDGMVVDGATITRDGATVVITFASATNVFQSTNLASQTRIKSIDVYTAN